MVERRQFRRVPYTDGILINGSILVKGVDISEGGLYAHTGRKFALDSYLRVKFTVLGNELELTAQVKSCQESVGMGLSFLEVHDHVRAIIRKYVESYKKEVSAARKKIILLVDDNDANRRINKSKLVLDGFSVVEAADGVEAIAKLAQGLPDAVVLDLYMEKMDGYKVLAYIKGNGDLKGIPVVVLSARGGQTDIDRAMSAGADGFLAKMKTSPAKLSEYVKKVIEGKSAPA